MIVITGANGFVGSAVARVLARSHPELNVVCLVRPNASLDRLDDLIADDLVSIRTGDLTSQESCARAIDGADTVYHFAAGMGGGAMADVWMSTVVSTRNLLRAVNSTTTIGRFVHCSSFSVYGVGAVDRGATVTESTPTEPRPGERDDYAHAKLRQEQLVRELLEPTDTELVVVRPGVIYGPGGSTGISGRVGMGFGRLFLWLGRRNKLPLSYIDNCADAIALVGQLPETAGETINILDDEGIPASSYLWRYQKALDKKLLVIPFPYTIAKVLGSTLSKYAAHSEGQMPAAVTPFLVRSNWGGNDFSNEKLRSFGWQQRVTTEQGLDAYFNYVQRTQ